MKSHLSILLTTFLLGAANLATAQVLLTDDFTVTSNVNSQPNFEIANRQGGTLATSNYTISNVNATPPGQNLAYIQLGNTSTNVGQPGGASNGNYLLLANRSGVQNDLATDNTLADGKPLKFEFDLYATFVAPGNNTVWASFSLRPAATNSVNGGAGAWPGTTAAGQFSLLKRVNGEVVAFFGSSAGTVIGTTSSSSFSITFSGIDGTGSAFTGSGSMVSIWAGGVELDTRTFTSLSSTGLRFGFIAENNARGGVDNFVLTAVPEPSTYGIVMAGSLLLLVVARKRRRAL